MEQMSLDSTGEGAFINDVTYQRLGGWQFSYTKGKEQQVVSMKKGREGRANSKGFGIGSFVRQKGKQFFLQERGEGGASNY